MNQIYEDFQQRLKEISSLESISGILSWDQETYMPSKGGELRSDQLALISSLSHARLTCEAMGRLLEELGEMVQAGKLSEDQAVNVREVKHSYDRQKKLPTEFVEEMARTVSLSQQAWVKARQESDFGQFQPWLEKVVALKRQAAALYGYEGDLYDALIEDYEPGCTVEHLDPIFAELREQTVSLVETIQSTGKKPDRSILEREYPVRMQQTFGLEIARAMGFDFEAGRLDVSAHPFCSGMSPYDVRMTTRYNANDPLSSLYAIMHETGHGLYEQGLPYEHRGTPRGGPVSLGIHESQSRTWENCVGRSRAFWQFALPFFRKAFPGPAEELDLETVHFASNEVAPSLIRVEADEVTYNLHIILRYEIERDLLNRRVEVADLPEVWNTCMEEYLGLTPPNDAEGVLQDVHWSHGLFGYFPTYALGNLYGAQLFEAARRALPDLDRQIANGEFTPLRDWLRENIHQHGMKYRAAELVERVSGSPPGSDCFLAYMKSKFSELYGL